MALNQTTYSTRPLSLLFLAAFAGVALWLFAPSFAGGGSAPGGTESAPSLLPSMLTRSGSVVVETTGDSITRIIVPVSLRGDDPIDLTGGKLHAETALAATALAAVPATYSIGWQSGDGDEVLEPGEVALLSAELPDNNNITAENPLRLVFKSAGGPSLVIEDVLGR